LGNKKKKYVAKAKTPSVFFIDIDTLQLVSRVVSSVCRPTDAREVDRNAFELLSNFDEIISLGYRENVNLAQVASISEMDSHEEKIQEMIEKVEKVAHQAFMHNWTVQDLTLSLRYLEQGARSQGRTQAQGQDVGYAEEGTKKGHWRYGWFWIWTGYGQWWIW
jgi:hypothetical protein